LIRTACSCAPAALGCVSAALAQPTTRPVLVSEIAAQPLTQALTAFANQTGLQLVYVSEEIGESTSNPIPAGTDLLKGLTRLLRGTGLRFRFLTANSIRVFRYEKPRPTDSTSEAPGTLHEVVITASRREEELQDVPITVEVLTGSQLERLNATTFDDFAGALPGVTAHGVGPGQNNIYVRGLATVEPGQQAVIIGGAFSNVAVYLDEQSAQFPNHNLDVYTVDLERIEILEGPQGTLFGAGAQAGVLRYITNKPKLNRFEGQADVGYGWTRYGAPSRNADVVINVPVATDKFAARALIYDEKRGGYIDNIPSTFARSDSDAGIHYAYADGKVPINSMAINNLGIAHPDFNPVTYRGARLQTLYQANEDWSALLSLSEQNMEADGVFAEMAANSAGEPQPDLSVQQFNPSYLKDRFADVTLTIQGRIDALKILYAGGYLVRTVEQQQDYTQYARGLYADYYQCANPTAASGSPNPAAAQCFTPSATWHDRAHNTHQSHELRISTPEHWRFRAVGGLFYEDFRIQDETDWYYQTATPYFNPIAPPTGYWVLNGKVVCTCQPEPGATLVDGHPATTNNPHTRPANDAFFNDLTRRYTQNAAYFSADLEIIPKALTLTAGTRYFDIHDALLGASVGSFGCQIIFNPTAPNPCVNRDTANIDAEHLHPTDAGFTSRVNLTWRVNGDSLVYYTWSQGFRPGSFNRPLTTPLNSPLAAPSNPSSYQATAAAHGGWQPSRIISPDHLVNNELGWKAQWLSGTLQWDGAIYQEIWSAVQAPVSDPGTTPPAVLNGGTYRVRGAESTFRARLWRGFRFETGGSFNRNKLVREGALYWADGTRIDFGQLQTADGGPVANPTGSLGSELAAAPVFQGYARVRYEYPWSTYHAFVQLGAMHQSQSLASTDKISLDLKGNSIAYRLPEFTTYDAAVGLRVNSWQLQAYGSNLSDTRAQLYANYHQAYKAVTVSRPRTVGLRASFTF
jgi:iron complex outermembrane receptor protein